MTATTTPTTTPPRTHDVAGRDRILREAAQLFLTRGYAETSMRTIAGAADVRPASIYHHFSSKDTLLAEILSIGMDAVTHAFAEAAALAATSPRARLEAHVAAHLHALFAHHAFTAAHVTVFPFAPVSVRRAAVAERDQYESQWTALLLEVAPHMTSEATRVVRLALFGAMNSSVHWFDAAEGSVDDLAEAIVQTLWDGLGATP